MILKSRRVAARRAVASGDWMIRTGDPISSHDGEFRWNPIGEWTEALDWDPTPRCGGGLHGQGPEAGGYRHHLGHVLFCETRGGRVIISGNKIKVRRARVLLIDEIPSNLRFEGSLDLSSCRGLRSLPEDLSVGCNLYLNGCSNLTSLPDGLSVGGALDLSGCSSLTSLPPGLSVGGSLDLNGCFSLISLPPGLSVGCSLYLTGCSDLTSLPVGLSVRGSLWLKDCSNLTSLPLGLSVGGEIFGWG